MHRRELGSSCSVAALYTALLTPLMYLIHADEIETERSTIAVKLVATSIVTSAYIYLEKFVYKVLMEKLRVQKRRRIRPLPKLCQKLRPQLPFRRSPS